MTKELHRGVGLSRAWTAWLGKLALQQRHSAILDLFVIGWRTRGHSDGGGKRAASLYPESSVKDALPLPGSDVSWWPQTELCPTLLSLLPKEMDLASLGPKQLQLSKANLHSFDELRSFATVMGSWLMWHLFWWHHGKLSPAVRFLLILYYLFPF